MTIHCVLLLQHTRRAWKKILPTYLHFGQTISPRNLICTSQDFHSLSQLTQDQHVPHTPRNLQPSFLPTITNIRHYAKKSKDKKHGKGTGKPKMSLTLEELNEVVHYDRMCEQMDSVLEHLKQEYIDKLSLRTSSGALDNLIVDTPDGKFPLIQLGQIAQKTPQLIVINLSSLPQYIPGVKKAIEQSGMNLNPQQESTSLIIQVPKVTREHREAMSKSAKTLCDKTKEKLRDVHNKFLKEVKKKTGHSEDVIKAVQEHIQVAYKDHLAKSDKLLLIKQKELTSK